MQVVEESLGQPFGDRSLCGVESTFGRFSREAEQIGHGAFGVFAGPVAMLVIATPEVAWVEREVDAGHSC